MTGRTKRVAHVRLDFWAQSETFLLNYINNLQHWEPVVLTSHLHNEPMISHLDIRLFPSVLDIRKGSLRWWRKQFFHFARSLDGEVLIYPLLRSVNPSLVHAHFGSDAGMILSCAKKLRIPLITTFYGFDLFRQREGDVWRHRFNELFQYGTRFLIEGPHMKRALIETGCPEEKVSIQRIAIDLTRYTFRERVFDSARPIRILLCGRFVEKKGFAYALEALARIADRYSVEIRIIGDGPDKPTLIDIVNRSDALHKAVTWCGMVDHEAVIGELDWTDMFLQPSVTAKDGDSEGGAPTTLLEAQACGVPIVATQHADIPYVTVPDKSALLVPERDVDSLANAIDKLISIPSRWHDMAWEGKRHVESNHDIRQEVQHLEEVYDRVSAATSG